MLTPPRNIALLPWLINHVCFFFLDNYVHRLVQTKGDGKPIEWNRVGGESSHEEKLDSLQLEVSLYKTLFILEKLQASFVYFWEYNAIDLYQGRVK